MNDKEKLTKYIGTHDCLKTEGINKIIETSSKYYESADKTVLVSEQCYEALFDEIEDSKVVFIEKPIIELVENHEEKRS